MFSLFAMLLSSIASFLFPVFASYKALKTSDPAQLAPWLMYWVVFACCLLVESWFSFILFWIPFYSYIRFCFLLYLILPQTQGARIIYEERVHPFLEQHETDIDEFISTAHDRLKSAGLAYFRRAIEYVKTQLLGLPASDPAPPEAAGAGSGSGAGSSQSYTQSLLARFSVPAARWSGNAAGNAGSDFYNLVASAVAAATGTGGASQAAGGAGGGADMSASGNLIPPHLRDSGEKMSFIAAQRERLNIVLTALDREAQNIQQHDASATATGSQAGHAAHHRALSMSYDGAAVVSDDDDNEPTQRPPSGLSVWSALSKSRSEADFEKIEAESAPDDDGAVRRRKVSMQSGEAGSGGSGGGSWMPWGWGASSNKASDDNNNDDDATGASSARES